MKVISTEKKPIKLWLDDFEKLTIYLRSKFSQDCSRNETEEERNTEMVERQGAKNILLSSHIQLLEEMREEVEEDIPPRKTEEETHNTYNDGKRDALQDTLTSIDEKLAEYKKII